MTVHDGNGWTRCGLGHRHWGRHGAAGLLVAAPDEAGVPVVLLQQRSGWGQHGGTWGPPGGARDSHESAVRAALREAAEECAIEPSRIRVHGILREEHGGWDYRTVLARSSQPLPVAAVSDETHRVAWVPVTDVAAMRLHPGFAAQWPILRVALTPVTVIVDAANVVGARPDGWWRDRAGAAARLIDQLAKVAEAGVADMPAALGLPPLERWYPRLVVVLEGVARAAGQDVTAHGKLSLRLAPGSGDDEIARLAGELAGHRLVVTADRELRARCEAAGAAVTGPSWLLDQL